MPAANLWLSRPPWAADAHADTQPKLHGTQRNPRPACGATCTSTPSRTAQHHAPHRSSTCASTHATAGDASHQPSTNLSIFSFFHFPFSGTPPNRPGRATRREPSAEPADRSLQSAAPRTSNLSPTVRERTAPPAERSPASRARASDKPTCCCTGPEPHTPANTAASKPDGHATNPVRNGTVDAENMPGTQTLMSTLYTYCGVGRCSPGAQQQRSVLRSAQKIRSGGRREK